MLKTKRASLFCAIVLALLCAPVHAAPDRSPGMALMFAVVNGDGTLLRSAGAISAELAPAPPDGRYNVVFDRDVSGCVYTATVGSPGSRSSNGGSGLTPGIATASSLSGVPEGVFVEIHDFDGNGVATSFHLMVFCAK
jgi:hypothetical protein